MLVILLVSLIFHAFPVSSELRYEISEVYMADTERYEPYTEPYDESRWAKYSVDAQYLGLLFAGKSEFSWVVDLRVHNSDAELRSTGNLISSMWVLTTCRAKYYLEKAWGAVYPSHRAFIGSAIAMFFQLYVWEFNEGRIFDYYQDKWIYGGTRKIGQSVAHPRCNVRKMKNDIALLKLEQEISPAPPFIGFMPALRVPGDDHKFADIDLTSMENERKICFVASVGRDYVNVKFQHLVVDFKVRFRVYYENLANCTNLVNRLCDNSELDCREAFRSPGIKGRDWNCMRTRARVGTVCDHDRGAPVVCDDEVIGIVAYGASFKYCNNRIPMPFIVIKLHSYSDWTHGNSLNPMNEPWDGKE